MKNSLNKITQKKWYSWSVIAMSAMLYSLGMNAFVNKAGIFPSGLMSFANLVVYLSPSNISAYLSIIYLIFNIPLIFFFWKKIKRSYIYKSLFFLLVQALFGLIFLIPQVNEMLSSIFWPNLSLEEIRDKRWTIIVMACLGGVVAAVGMGLAWKHGGSAGGTDFVTYYYSYKYKKPIGKINRTVSLVMVGISFVVAIAANRPQQIREFWFIVLIGTLLYVFVLVVIVDLIYPKYSKVQLEIHSSNPQEISRHLKMIKFPHSWSISEIQSGFTGQNKKVIKTTILLLELRELVRELYKIDNKVWINVMKVQINYGSFNTESVDKRN